MLNEIDLHEEEEKILSEKMFKLDTDKGI